MGKNWHVVSRNKIAVVPCAVNNLLCFDSKITICVFRFTQANFAQCVARACSQKQQNILLFFTTDRKIPSNWFYLFLFFSFCSRWFRSAVLRSEIIISDEVINKIPQLDVRRSSKFIFDLIVFVNTFIAVLWNRLAHPQRIAFWYTLTIHASHICPDDWWPFNRLIAVSTSIWFRRSFSFVSSLNSVFVPAISSPRSISSDYFRCDHAKHGLSGYVRSNAIFRECPCMSQSVI